MIRLACPSFSFLVLSLFPFLSLAIPIEGILAVVLFFGYAGVVASLLYAMEATGLLIFSLLSLPDSVFGLFVYRFTFQLGSLRFVVLAFLFSASWPVWLLDSGNAFFILNAMEWMLV